MKKLITLVLQWFVWLEWLGVLQRRVIGKTVFETENISRVTFMVLLKQHRNRSSK